MGNFRIEIDAIGGHGESRDIRDGEDLDLAGLPSTSVDRVAHEAVESLKGRGASIVSARIVHWPGQSSEVVDDVLAKTRHGSF